MKISVIGLGGVGGYIGALLAKKYDEVTFIVRRNRIGEIVEHGITLNSDYRGSFTVKPLHTVTTTENLPVQDYVFICVKNYSLEEACDSIKTIVNDNTVVIPVMNGVDPGDRIRTRLGKGKILDSLIYIVSFIGQDGSIIQQGNFGKIEIGTKQKELQDIAKKTSMLLNEAGIDCEYKDDIEAAIWRKYVLNCAYNVETAYYNQPIGPLRTDAVKAKEYESLVWEAYSVGIAKGVHLLKSDAEHIIDRFYHDHADDATSSLQRDVAAGKKTELETFCGYIVREGQRLNIDVSVITRMYDDMKKRVIFNE